MVAAGAFLILWLAGLFFAVVEAARAALSGAGGAAGLGFLVLWTTLALAGAYFGLRLFRRVARDRRPRRAPRPYSPPWRSRNIGGEDR